MDKFLEIKWKKLLSRVWLFDLIPFINFVLVAGSMAMGNPKEDSDFDVIVGVKSGRIFSARFYCWLFFGFLGWRKKKDDLGAAKKDKFCFSHFITTEKYCLSEPYNEYWNKLYMSLVPIYGTPDLIQKFYDENAGWMGERRSYKNDGKNRYKKPGLLKTMKERALSGRFGNLLEKWLRKIQISKIKKSLKIEKQYKPRIIFNDSELEFHPHTKRIEEYVNKLKAE